MKLRELDAARGAAAHSARCSATRGSTAVAVALGEVALEQPIVVEVVRAADHGFPPSRARSFRAARNRWTRTVDSFSPVIALTSRGVQSP